MILKYKKGDRAVFLQRKKAFKIVVFTLAFLLAFTAVSIFFFATGDTKIASAKNQNYNDRASINFYYNGKSYRYVDNLITPTDHLVADEIYTRKINGSLGEKLLLVERILHSGTDYKTAMSYCFPLLYKTIDKVTFAVNTEPVDSKIKFNPSQKPYFKVTKEAVGYEIDTEALFRDAYTHLRRNLTTPLAVRPKIIAPAITANDNAKLTYKRAKFYTSYANSSIERKNNIELAISKINGYILEPNAEFSFNKVVGARTSANGYKAAKIIVGGEYVDGVGGGVCQASTTIYNAALLADMQITQVHNHSLLSSYAPPSFDAMVNSGFADLRFKNLGANSVFIKAVADGQKILVEFFGTKLDYEISTKSVTLSTTPAPPDKEELDLDYRYFDPLTAISGEVKRIARGRGALKSEGYLLYHDTHGNLIEKKAIRKDSYKALAGTVVVAP